MKIIASLLRLVVHKTAAHRHAAQNLVGRTIGSIQVRQSMVITTSLRHAVVGLKVTDQKAVVRKGVVPGSMAEDLNRTAEAILATVTRPGHRNTVAVAMGSPKVIDLAAQTMGIRRADSSVRMMGAARVATVPEVAVPMDAVLKGDGHHVGQIATAKKAIVRQPRR